MLQTQPVANTMNIVELTIWLTNNDDVNVNVRRRASRHVRTFLVHITHNLLKIILTQTTPDNTVHFVQLLLLYKCFQIHML